jgi:hypothetical protein
MKFMKRQGNLFQEITNFNNLYRAYLKARKGKRNRASTVLFDLELESNLFELRNELINKTYKVSKYNTFKIYQPKERDIMSLPFRDRIVQQAIVTHVIEPIFGRHFIKQNVACQKGKGTHFGLKISGQYLQKQFYETGGGYILKCDISKYFYRIQHSVLKEQYRKLIKDKDVIWLLDLIVDSTDGDEGIPIGNLTSQYFALLYLSEFDHFVKESLRIKYYIRYMDDFLLIHPDKEYLKCCLRVIKKYLDEKLKLELNSKTNIFPLRNGVDFLWFHTYITKTGKIIRKLRQDSKRRMKHKMKFFVKAYKNGWRSMKEIKPVIASWTGHAKHGNTYQLRKKIFSKYKFEKGDSP